VAVVEAANKIWYKRDSSTLGDYQMLGMNKEQFMSFLRHLITFVGGIIVAKGNLDPGTVETLSGIVITIAGLLWGMFSPDKGVTTEHVIMANLGEEKKEAIDKIIAAPTPAKPKTEISVNQGQVTMQPKLPPQDGA
jgi:hypothetical protein